VSDLDRLVDERVGLRRLLGNGVNGVLEDLPLALRHKPEGRSSRRPPERL
jgi:hypothetical protein